MKNLKAVLFDLDGTLLKSREVNELAIKTALQKVGLPLKEEMLKLAFNQETKWAFFRAYPDARDKWPTFRAEYLTTYFEQFPKMAELYDDVLPVLRELKRLGIKTGLVTTKDGARTEAVIRHFGLAEFFETIVDGDAHETARPDPTPLLIALNRLNLEPKNTLYVGDTPEDIAQGKAARVATAAVVRETFTSTQLKPAKPNLILPRLLDLLVLLPKAV